MFDQRGGELERTARLDRPLGWVGGNLLKMFIDA
jgi:hypothetical protein